MFARLFFRQVPKTLIPSRCFCAANPPPRPATEGQPSPPKVTQPLKEKQLYEIPTIYVFYAVFAFLVVQLYLSAHTRDLRELRELAEENRRKLTSLESEIENSDHSNQWRFVELKKVISGLRR